MNSVARLLQQWDRRERPIHQHVLPGKQLRLSLFDLINPLNKQNAYPTLQHCSGPTRIGLAHPWRFQPYGTPHARATEHPNAEAGPSSLSLLRVPYVGLQTPHPSGGLSEATTDAVTTQPTTEEDGDSVSDFYSSHIPRVAERSPGVRNQHGRGFLVG